MATSLQELSKELLAEPRQMANNLPKLIAGLVKPQGDSVGLREEMIQHTEWRKHYLLPGQGALHCAPPPGAPSVATCLFAPPGLCCRPLS